MLEAVVNIFQIKRKTPKDVLPTLLFPTLLKCGVIGHGGGTIPAFTESNTTESSSGIIPEKLSRIWKIGDH